jgi:hypothetical protein
LFSLCADVNDHKSTERVPIDLPITMPSRPQTVPFLSFSFILAFLFLACISNELNPLCPTKSSPASPKLSLRVNYTIAHIQEVTLNTLTYQSVRASELALEIDQSRLAVSDLGSLVHLSSDLKHQSQITDTLEGIVNVTRSVSKDMRKLSSVLAGIVDT